MIVLLSLVIFLCSLAFFFVYKKFQFWKSLGFVSATTNFPFGNLKGVGTKIPSFQRLEEYYNEFKGKIPVLGLYFFFSPTLMVLDIELIKNVFIRDFTSFHDRGFYYNKKDDPLSANLVRILLDFFYKMFSFFFI
jgi:cytochrome P450 family 6